MFQWIRRWRERRAAAKLPKHDFTGARTGRISSQDGWVPPPHNISPPLSPEEREHMRVIRSALISVGPSYIKPTPTFNRRIYPRSVGPYVPTRPQIPLSNSARITPPSDARRDSLMDPTDPLSPLNPLNPFNALNPLSPLHQSTLSSDPAPSHCEPTHHRSDSSSSSWSDSSSSSSWSDSSSSSCDSSSSSSSDSSSW